MSCAAPDVDLVVLGAREEEIAIGIIDDLGERTLVACDVKGGGDSREHRLAHETRARERRA